MDWKFILTSLDGRIGKKTYWIAMLGMIAVNLVVAVLTGDANWQPGQPLFSTASTVVALVLLWPMLAVAGKRWHDQDKSAWFNLLYFIPLVNLVALIWNGVADGTPGNNRFGGIPPY